MDATANEQVPFLIHICLLCDARKVCPVKIDILTHLSPVANLWKIQPHPADQTLEASSAKDNNNSGYLTIIWAQF